MPVITINDVSKKFKGMQLFEGLSLAVEEGRTYGLRGPNGSGKSVLLKMICGFVQPDSGEVTVDPRFMSPGRTYPANFGIAINGPAYLPNLSAEGNLMELASIRKIVSVQGVHDVLTAVGLVPGSKQKVRNFSMGMKQKLSIAQALMEDPQVLLLDEPMNALDEESVVRIKKLLRAEQRRGKTIIFTSHNRADIDDLCDEVFDIVGYKVRHASTPGRDASMGDQ